MLNKNKLKGIEEEEHKAYHRRMLYVVMMLLLFLFGGATFYHYAEKWRYLDAIYFSAYTMTTLLLTAPTNNV